MRSIWISLAAVTTVLFTSDARAFAPDGPESGLVVRTPDVRTTSAGVFTTPQRATTAFQRFVAATGAWQSVWDRDTGMPLRMWGRGIMVPGAQKNPAAAAAAARLLIEAHLDLFAPGTSPGELEIIGNTETAELRRVTFAQRWRGMRVVGATVTAMFKRDRLIVLGSSALPDVSASLPTSAVAPSATAARRWVTAGTGLDVAVTTTGAPEVFAEIRPGDIRYTVVRPLVVEATAGLGRWTVWIDAATGEPVARVSRILFGDGTLTYNTPEREAPGPRVDVPAAFVTVMVDGAPVTSTFAGRLTWPGTALASVVTTLTGPYVVVSDGGGHPLATATLSLADGGTVSWNLATDEFGDGQITTFTHVNVVKAKIRHEINPFLPWVDGQIMVSANENNLCNAYADLEPDQIHFFINGDGGGVICENTGRMPDVVYHEVGHNFHYRSLVSTGTISDVGGFFTGDIAALSEGLSDTLATSLTASPIIGPGFFVGDPNGIRNLDPTVDKRYPEDLQGQSHADGEIIGGTIWDLRKALVISLGEERGQIVTNRAFRGVVSNSATFPETYADAIAADDDDGNLANGTPHQCEISRAFFAHGLAPALAGGVAIGTPRIDAGSFVVPITTPAADCPGLTVTGVTIAWQVRGNAAMSGTVPLTPGPAWTGTVPVLPDGTVIQYDVEVTFSDASTTTRPLNQADPYYEAYLGASTPILCDDFEAADPGWTHAATTGVDEWARGPGGVAPAAGDPDGAASGAGIFGTDLADNGLYTAATDTYAETPMIDVRGYATVRLQYKRWLDVDDGFLDQATISVGGTTLWQNLAGDAASATNVHRDGEWRFHDVDLTAQAAAGNLAVRFGLVADATSQYGGWSMDDVCVVGVGAVCGDTFMRGGEECDDGNLDDDDGCSATCVIEIPSEGGCCSTGTDPRGALAVTGFGALGLLVVLRRRRRR